jgi:hypothetical protein
MGLDNIPKEYPCALKAARDKDNRIDCAQTQNENNCTWKNEKESNPMVNHISGATSMFGTDCWYRGKYGNFLINILNDTEETETSEYHFYGKDGDGLDPDNCFDMAKWMRDNTEKFAFNAKEYVKNDTRIQIQLSDEESKPDPLIEYINDWVYAIWWLEFVGKTSNGSAVWW